jgi:hypothetical protein
MSIQDYGPRTDAEESAQTERYEGEARADAMCAIRELAEEVGKVLQGLRLSDSAIECISETMCEQLLDHSGYRAAFDSSGDGHGIAERAMIRAASEQLGDA